MDDEEIFLFREAVSGKVCMYQAFVKQTEVRPP